MLVESPVHTPVRRPRTEKEATPEKEPDTVSTLELHESLGFLNGPATTAEYEYDEETVEAITKVAGLRRGHGILTIRIPRSLDERPKEAVM